MPYTTLGMIPSIILHYVMRIVLPFDGINATMDYKTFMIFIQTEAKF